MTPAELERRLREVRDTPAKSAAMQAADEIREGIERAPWLDSVRFAEIQDALRARGLHPAQAWEPAPLRVGETYLLLYDGEREAGLVGRLRAVDVPLAADPFDADAKHEVETAYRALVAALGQRGRELPEGIRPRGFELPIGRASFAVTGGSLGVSVCVAPPHHRHGRPHPRRGRSR